MNIKKILTILTLIVLALSAGALVYFNTKTDVVLNGDPVLTNTTNNEIKEPVKVNNGKKLSCYDFINTLLEKDGFTHLEGTKWSRGENNFFIFDLEKEEFQIADAYHTDVLPSEWYKNEYEKYVSFIYRNETRVLDFMSFDGASVYVAFSMDNKELNDTENGFYDFPIWMDYYLTQFETYGCSYNPEFKTQLSTATVEDVISVFDVKSTDGVIRYFNDVHVEGDVKDHPRYIEVQSFEEFHKVKDEYGFEIMYMFNIISSNKGKVFETESDHLQASIIEEFVKDVVYPNIPERNDAKQVETLGIYFIDIDNPNGNFKSLYKAPTKGVPFYYEPELVGKDLRKLSTPYEGTVIGANKNTSTTYDYTPFSVSDIQNVLDDYIRRINAVNASVSFSDDFIRNYTRPFAYEWQKQMGLTELFNKKYGFIDHSIVYLN